MNSATHTSGRIIALLETDLDATRIVLFSMTENGISFNSVKTN